ncbi:MAG: hypothetical protein AAF368_08120, partial [Planctomycetota bacterium]
PQGTEGGMERLRRVRDVEEQYHLARHRAVYDLVDRGVVLGSSTDRNALELSHPGDTGNSVFVVAPVGDMLHLVELRRGEQTEFFRLLDKKTALEAERRMSWGTASPFNLVPAPGDK